MENKENIIGSYRKIVAGNKVWSIALQQNIIFCDDVVVKVTSQSCLYEGLFLGKVQTINKFYGAQDTAHGDIRFKLDDSYEYIVEPTEF